ncbi:hypothetical protein V1477_002128 [Vespula maculifrons]|uniref:Uncharacterized protein n=1 Tax=Vespula maculifrons TaxID=7453 RepID=A0ABD2CY43_VESMC
MEPCSLQFSFEEVQLVVHASARDHLVASLAKRTPRMFRFEISTINSTKIGDFSVRGTNGKDEEEEAEEEEEERKGKGKEGEGEGEREREGEREETGSRDSRVVCELQRREENLDTPLCRSFRSSTSFLLFSFRRKR